jgi:tetratricopeptide (TPR) repeat protein
MDPIRAVLERTLSYYEKKEYANAEKGADEILATYPEFNRALFLKAVILEETGRSGEAEKYYAKAGPLHQLWLRLALQLQDADPARALTYFKKVSEMDAESNLVWLSMGDLYEKLGRPDEAKKSYANISLQREIITKLVSPVGFLIIMTAGSIAMLQRGNIALASLVIASGVVCLFWLKRDGGRAWKMMKKKKKYA